MINVVVLQGNLTRDPELRHTGSGTAVASLRIASNRVWYTGSHEKREETLFVDVTVWGKTAENCAEHLAKGSKVLIDGRLTYREWEKDGHKRSTVEVTADTVQFLSWKKDGQGEDEGAPPRGRARSETHQGSAPGEDKQADPDEVPF